MTFKLLETKVNVKDCISCKCICFLIVGCSNFKCCRCIVHMIWRVLGNISCGLDAKVKLCICIVNASPQKPLDIATFCVTLIPRSRSEIKAGICDGVPSTAV